MGMAQNPELGRRGSHISRRASHRRVSRRGSHRRVSRRGSHGGVVWGTWEIRGSKWDHHDAAGQTCPYRSSVRQCTRPAPFEPRLPPARTHEMKGKFSAPSSTFAITQRQKQQMHHVYTAWERRYCYIWFESDRLARTSHCSKGNKSGMFYAVLFSDSEFSISLTSPSQRPLRPNNTQPRSLNFAWPSFCPES